MKNVLVAGGDFRQIVVARELKKSGYIVKIFGFNEEYSEGLDVTTTLSETVSQADVIILGLPALKSENMLNTPLWSKVISSDRLLSSLKENAVVLGGMLSEDFIGKISEKTKNVFDYYKREALIIKNVVPTAEAAIAIAVNETAITVKDSKCLVTGYGRIGKYLSDLLKSMGADVTVSARKEKDIALIGINGFKAVNTGNIKEIAGDFDLIINTVPHMILTGECIDNIRKDAVIIDLASKPGGVDMNYAKQKGISTIWALSLPGKTAPVTAGKIIKETVESILNELGV